MSQLSTKLKQLAKRLDQIRNNLDPEAKAAKIKELEAESTDPAFWKDEPKAKEVMQHLAHLKQEQESISSLGKEISDAQEMVNLASESKDESITQDIQIQIKKLNKALDKLEINTFLSGKYDKNNVILSIHAGQGGTEAMDWAEMLLRMYTRYIESQDNFKFEKISETRGEEAGIKSATLIITGPFAYGYLKGEAGTHRLVRQSPFNADNLRQTSFALVEVLPQIEDDADITIKDDDLEWQFFRSSGKGGQNVNKVSTAVRLKHLPTKIVVESQAQRRQEQNRKIALSLLKGKLWHEKEQKRNQQINLLKGQKMASWGTQIRSYVLHPYKQVKDLRTQVESKEPDNVLDGNLEKFIESQIKQIN